MMQIRSAGAQVDAKTEELIEEFRSHAAEVRAKSEFAGVEECVIFEGWAIQKIAGLQLLVLELVDHVQRLEAALRRKVPGTPSAAA